MIKHAVPIKVKLHHRWSHSHAEIHLFCQSKLSSVRSGTADFQSQLCQWSQLAGSATPQLTVIEYDTKE